MANHYSMDLRGRAVAAAEIGALSCHHAAAPFGIGVSHSVIVRAALARDRQRCA
jgi:transposase